MAYLEHMVRHPRIRTGEARPVATRSLIAAPVGRRRTSSGSGEGRPSATVFVSKVILGVIAVVFVAALIADVLWAVTVPLGVLFGTGLIAIALIVGLLVEADDRRAARREAAMAVRRAASRPEQRSL